MLYQYSLLFVLHHVVCFCTEPFEHLTLIEDSHCVIPGRTTVEVAQNDVRQESEGVCYVSDEPVNLLAHLHSFKAQHSLCVRYA